MKFYSRPQSHFVSRLIAVSCLFVLSVCQPTSLHGSTRSESEADVIFTKMATSTVERTANYMQQGTTTPTISWSTPADITYGTPLSEVQLSATSNVNGNFVYSPAAGAVLTAGAQTLSVTFTPSDPSYSQTTTTVTLNVDQATPIITWPTPAPITWPTPFGPTQQNATANVPGNFAYSPKPGVVEDPGSSKVLNVTFTPTDRVNYIRANANVTMVILPATPVITWNPTPMVYGSLGADQLNASTPVDGRFTYSPDSGYSEVVGTHTLSTTFYPTNTLDYNEVTVHATLVVSKATPTITWSPPASIVYGTALSVTQLNATSDVLGNFVYTQPSGTVLDAGQQTLATTFTASPHGSQYNTVNSTVPLLVKQASQTITFSSPGSTAVLGAGPITLSATASSGLPVSFSIVSGPASINGNALTFTGAGAVVVAADQSGTNNFSAATTVTQSITVLPPAGNVALSQLYPSSGAPGEFPIAILGTGFGNTAGLVSFGGQAVIPISWSDSKITFRVPSNAVTSVVSIQVGGMSSSGLLFTVGNVTSCPVQ